MECREVYNLMNRFVDGEITVEEEKVLEIHLERCAYCREEFGYLKELNESLNTLEPGHDFTQKIMAQIKRDREKKRLKYLPRTSWGWVRVAAIVLLFFTTISLWWAPKPTSEVIISTGQVMEGTTEEGNRELTIIDGTIQVKGLQGSLNAVNSQIFFQEVKADLKPSLWDHIKSFYERIKNWFIGDE